MIKDYINQEKHSFPLSLLQDSCENDNQEIVYLKEALQSIQKQAGILPCAIGKSVDGQFYFDLARAHHVLIAGDTGAGKSVLLHSIILSLLYNKRPDELQFVLIDPKNVEFDAYHMISNYAKVIHESNEAIAELDSIIIEMDNRFELFKKADVQNIEEYNHLSGQKSLPFIVVVIDEFADLMFIEGEAFESKLSHLAALAHRVGIHLVISTQRPSCNVISGSIKANFATRIAFMVTSEFDSIVILDGIEATELSCPGDLIYSERNTCVRLRGTYVSEQDIEKVTEYIESNYVE